MSVEATSKPGGIDWSRCTIVPATSEAASGSKKKRAKKTPNGKSHKKATRFLKEQDFLFDASLPTYVLSPDGDLLFANDASERLAAAFDADAAAASKGSSQRTSRSVRRLVDQIRQTGEAVGGHERVYIDGKERIFLTRHFPVVDPGGELVAVGAAYTDVTAEISITETARLAHQRFLDFARSTSDWFWEIDRELRITVLSERFSALVEQPSALFFGRRLDEIGDFHPNLNGEEPIRDALERRVPFREQLIEITSSEAGRLLFHLNGVPSFDKQSGDFVGFRGSGMDVTQKYQQTAQAQEIRRNLESTLYELKHKNTQLDIASVQAESALRAKNEFLAAMSHELRTPLNAIIGFAEAMKLEVFGDLNEKYVTYCADIMDAGRHLLGLINDVLDVAVIESGELTVTIEDASLKSMLEQAVKLLELRAAHKKLDLSACAVKPEQDFLVSVDLRRATQIFLNLLTNAVKFTPEKGAIGIDIDRVSRSHVAATIWDTGIGIPADQLDAVFEKFQQVGDDVYSRKAEGTGLGLHISRELARQMGGDITLESTPGEGSQFTVTLPISSLNDGS